MLSFENDTNHELLPVLDALILRWEKEIVEFNFNDQYYKDMIIEYIKKFGKASKQDITKLLSDKLPDILDEKQKINKIRNLLYSLRRQDIIVPNSENQRKSYWVLGKNAH